MPNVANYVLVLSALGGSATATPIANATAFYRKPVTAPPFLIKGVHTRTGGAALPMFTASGRVVQYYTHVVGAATLPMFTASGRIIVLVHARGAGVLPMFTTSALARVLVRSRGAGVLPMFTTSALVRVLVEARGLARLPMLTASGVAVAPLLITLHPWTECLRPGASTWQQCVPVSTLRSGDNA